MSNVIKKNSQIFHKLKPEEIKKYILIQNFDLGGKWGQVI